MSLATATTPTDPSPPVPSRTFWSFWAFSLIGAPILAVLGFFALGHFTVAAVFIVAAVVAVVFWLIARGTSITSAMALGGFVLAAVATMPWAYAALFVLVVTGQVSFS